MKPQKQACKCDNIEKQRCECKVPGPAQFDDFMGKILSLLPVKPLVRFKCVSKSWNSLISNPYFAKLHLHRWATNPTLPHHRVMTVANNNNSICELGIDNEYRVMASWPLGSLLRDPSRTVAEVLRYPSMKVCKLVGYCNGLFCLANVFVQEQGESQEHWLRLWNPATRSLSEKLPSFYKERLRLKSYSFVKFGFGYDHVSDAYKVVGFICGINESGSYSKVKIHSVGDNDWRIIKLGFLASIFEEQNDGVHVRGTLNWLASRKFSSPNSEWNTFFMVDELLIVSLDMRNETFTQLRLPRIGLLRRRPTLAVLRDCLCLGHECRDGNFVIWQMKELGVDQSWTQLVKIPYSDGGCLTPLPLWLSEDDSVLMFSFYDSRLSLCNPRSTFNMESQGVPMTRDRPMVYVESLVTPCRNRVPMLRFASLNSC